MKKNIYKYLSILLAYILFGCEERLEEIGPEDDIPSSTIYDTELGAQAGIIGIYSTAQDKDTFGGTTIATDAFMTDDADFVGSFTTFADIEDYVTLSDNGSIDDIWRDLYQVIGAANVAINNIPNSTDPSFSQDEKNQFIGEAKFLRAMAYFWLANWFSQPFQFDNGNNECVPIIVDAFEEPSQLSNFRIERNTLNEVHELIESDLLDAISMLPQRINNAGRASQGAAMALLARLKLYREDWSEAASLSNQVIEDTNFILALNYDFYDQLSSEDVFTIVNTTDDGQDANIALSDFFNPTQTGGRGDAPFSDNLLETYDQGSDNRFIDLNQSGTDASGDSSIFTSKFPDGQNESDNFPIIRITEMYLIRAEANLRGLSSVGAEPIADINLLRQRAGLDPLTGTISLDQILLEKRKELAFEGHRRMDLLRNRMGLRRPGMLNIEESAFGADKTILPIPQRERDQNSLLNQNPGY